MSARGPLFCVICFCWVPVVPACGASAEVPPELIAFVNNAAAELASSPLSIPQFKSAVVDATGSLGKADGVERYLCWLKNDRARAGYVAVARRANSYEVMAFSPTLAPPDYFLKHVQVPQFSGQPLRLSLATRASFTTDVPLVTAGQTFLAGQPFEISELAACLSSVFSYFQNERKILLFADIGTAGDPQYSWRSVEDRARVLEPNDPNWRPFGAESSAAISRANIPEARTPEEETASRARRRETIKPIVRRRLLDPANARERLDVLAAELRALEDVTRPNISSGMRRAMLLQTDYLDRDPNHLGRDVQMFFRTRGRTARVEVLPFKAMRADAVPTVILGPMDLAAVVLGCMDVGGERFALVFLPKTGSPITSTGAQKMREGRVARGLPPEPNWAETTDKGVQGIRQAEEQRRRTPAQRDIPYSPPERDREREFVEGMKRIRAFYEKTVIVEDRRSASPARAEDGVHVVRCSTLASWRVLYVNKIEVGSNWGRGPSK
jgi:hypothetical protein